MTPKPFEIMVCGRHKSHYVAVMQIQNFTVRTSNQQSNLAVLG
uniref:Uncharacterized protein n=1 Tax=Anguilla anguilla TaxID=7936 RepID=A0A0E9RW79_ANGAN